MLNLGMTFEQAQDNIGAPVQYCSASGTIVTNGVIHSVGFTSVFVRFGQGLHTGEPVATDPRRLRLLPELFECDICGADATKLYDTDDGWVCAHCAPQRVVELPEPAAETS